MKVKFFNPFMKAFFSTLENMLGDKIERGSPSLRSSPYTGYEVSVMIGVTGDLTGQILYGMSLNTARRLAEALMFGVPVKEFLEMEKSVISELAQRITVQAKANLLEEGYSCVLTPPTLFTGAGGVQIFSVDIQTLVIPLVTSYGEIEVNLTLKERENL